MSSASWWELAIVAVALGLMALAATVEAASGLVSRHRLRQSAEDRAGPRRTVQGLLDPKRSLASSLVVVQAIAIATAASLLTTTFAREFDTAEHVLAVIAVGVVYLFVGRALPRALASHRPERAAMLLIPLAGLLSVLVRPLTKTIDASVDLLGRLLPGEPDDVPVGTEGELLTVVLEESDDGVIEAEEREMIDGVLQLEDRTARDIMVPRVDMIAVERSAPPLAIVNAFTRAGHSRVPVYEETIDNLIGVLYAKDLLPFVIGSTEQLPLADLLRPAYVVPESKRLDDLLKEMQRTKVHIAIVVDEYGGTAGLLTIEDILEEIVGEIQDEYDREEALFERIGETELVADGRLLIEDVEEALGVEISDDDFESIGGFVHKHLGRIPVQGDRFVAKGVRVEVLAVEGRRVRRLHLTKLPSTAGNVADPAPSDPNGAGPPERDRPPPDPAG